MMHTITRPLRYAPLCVPLLLPLTLQAGVPTGHAARLDHKLAAITEAVERGDTGTLMERSLQRQLLHQNTPLDARWNEAGEVQVYMHFAATGAAPSTDSLRQLGGEGIKVSPELGIVQAWIPAQSMSAAANLSWVTRMTLPRYAVVKRSPTLPRTTNVGSVTTQGDSILGSARFRSITGIRGEGVTVGVISDGDDHISGPQSTGDLPKDIWNDPRNAGGTGGFSKASSGDEGTAMMEIVYDVAPGVKQLGFCGPQTTVDFISCLNDFAGDIDANIIVDDLGFPGGAMFSQDTFTKAVEDFAKAHPDTRLVTAAGNDGTAFWAGTWGSPAPVSVSTTVNGITYTQAVNFGSDTSPDAGLDFLVHSGDTVFYVVEWDDPWNDAATTNDPNDYDVVLFNSGGAAIACNQGMNINPNNGTCTFPSPKQPLNTPGPTPVQGAQWQNTTGGDATVHLEVFKVAGSPGTRLKILVLSQGSRQVIVSPNTPAGSIEGHSALAFPTEITAGAIYAPYALSGTYDIEPYSSQGPVLYGFTGQAIQTIRKPDFVAPDCVSVTGAGGFSSPFCGTSAAAPHLAGLLALLKSGYPGQSSYTLLKTAAVQPGITNPNGIFGYGLPVLTNLLQAGDYPPVTAEIIAPADSSSVMTGQSIAFSGKCDEHGSSLVPGYTWNFSTGSGVPDSHQPAPKVKFGNAGHYTVTLTCSDASTSSNASIKITVTAPSGGGGGGFDVLLLGGLCAIGAAKLRRKRPN